MKLASFDIFDTTLIRKCGKPENIFYLLAHKLYPTDSVKREDFLLWRRDAERYAARIRPGKEITMEDIESFNEYSREELIAAEKSVEVENLIANPAIRDIIKEKREQGYTIGFISDMYLDSDTLKSALAKEDCIAEGEKVYVSCEWDARKSSGALYKKLKSTINPSQWEHYGDHPVSDVKKARENGITAHKVTTVYNSAEQGAIVPKSDKAHYSSSTLAGISRAARITFDNPYASLAADFIAPAYIPYTHFVIKKAKEKRIKNLYFLSRDSYILQRITECLPHEDIKLHYLFVSRKSLLLPYLYNASADKFLAIQDKNTIIGKSISSLLASLATTLEELKEKFGTAFAFDRITNKQQEEEFLEKIFGHNSTFLSELNRRAKEKQALLVQYFEQEKVFGSEKTAMVDVGWLGTTRLMINSILKEQGRPETEFFYYGVRGDVLGTQYGEYHTYFTPEQMSTAGTTLIENYFSASPYPSTIGYKRENEKIVPIFADNAIYKENDITSNNVSVSMWISNNILQSPAPLTDHFREWARNSVEEMLKLKSDIDITPLCKASEFDATSFVRPLSFKELLSIVCLGGRATAFDRGSLRISTGERIFPIVDRIAKFTGKIRRKLYLALKK